MARGATLSTLQASNTTNDNISSELLNGASDDEPLPFVAFGNSDDINEYR